jgi:signal transduction histidine kinase
MRNLLSKISLKRIFSLFTVTTIVLLLIVIFFAGKQYFLYRHCEMLVDSSQHLLFQFTGIKEHINETLLNKRPLNTPDLIKEIQGLDTRLQDILEDILIPEEFKLNFISQVDLVNITVALRNIQNSPEATNSEQIGMLSSQLRSINSKLNGFHQLISRYTQTQLLGLHKALVGMLSIVIALVSIMLLIINQYITSPILHYCRTLFPKEKEFISLFSLHETIETLATQPISDKSKTDTGDSRELTRLYRYSSIGHLLGGLSHELTNLSNGAINYTQAILDLSEDINLDHDSKELLQKLFIEEKKISQLLTNMITFTSGSANGEVKVLTMDELFENIRLLVHGTFKNEKINLAITMKDPALMLKNHVSDLQLVILSALQSSRTALTEKFTGNQSETGRKKIDIVFDEIVKEHNEIIIVIRDNGAPHAATVTESNQQSPGPWHNMSFCKDFLKTFGGNLTLSRDQDKTNLCRISIPFSEKEVN